MIFNFSKLRRLQLRFRSSATLRKEFYEDFARALHDGQGASVRVGKMIQRALRESDSNAILYDSWMRRMKRVSFAKSLDQSIPGYEVMVLTSAEHDGRLPEAMEYLAVSLKIIGKVNSAYIMSLFSPLMSFVVALGMLVTFSLKISPTMMQLMPLQSWPWMAKVLHYSSSFLVNQWFIVVGVVFGGFYLLRWSKDNWVGKLRNKVDHIYFLPWRAHRVRQADAFLISLSLMMQSGSIGLKEALLAMNEYATPWMRWHLKQMYDRFKLTPKEPVRCLDTGLFERNVMYRIEDFAERSTFEEGLKKIAIDNGDYTVEKATKNAFISSMFAVGLSGAFMLFFALANSELGFSLSSFMLKAVK